MDAWRHTVRAGHSNQEAHLKDSHTNRNTSKRSPVTSEIVQDLVIATLVEPQRNHHTAKQTVRKQIQEMEIQASSSEAG